MLDEIFLTIFGLFITIRFRWFGKMAMDQRKRIFGNFLPKSWFNEESYIFSQFLSLFVGLVLILVGLSKLAN